MSEEISILLHYTLKLEFRNYVIEQCENTCVFGGDDGNHMELNGWSIITGIKVMGWWNYWGVQKKSKKI